MRIASTEMLQRTLDGFMRSFNELRRHQALGGLTPEEAWQGMTMAEVQRAHAEGRARWVEEAFDGLIAESDCRMRC